MLDSAYLAALMPRADDGGAAAAAPPPDACATGNEYDGRIGLRVSALFVILVGSSLGALFPVWARPGVLKGGKKQRMNVAPWAFFVAKYFGSGVIVATAFIHLLAPAHEALSNPCLTGPITEYPWVEGIMLMTIVLLFFIELMVMRFARFGDTAIAREIEDGSYQPNHNHNHNHMHVRSRSRSRSRSHSSHRHRHGNADGDADGPCKALVLSHTSTNDHQSEIAPSLHSNHDQTHMPGQDHLGHARDHPPSDTSSNSHCHHHSSSSSPEKPCTQKPCPQNPSPHDNDNDHHNHSHNHHSHSHSHSLSALVEDYSAQLTSIFILEFGIIFHSIFIGLTLAVAGEEFITLYVVLVFHQTFEAWVWAPASQPSPGPAPNGSPHTCSPSPLGFPRPSIL
ncbi:hypothetical protein ACJ72_08620 [Emergomyces africanus]|uniref:Uncharacterized protein n=1 Tax=Emergomyces africanus TaxID=1955775 RepID=A0A1B7NJX4_9EURO|nr:hypothetical protein ACJ72_08620 [Emergomyces africanus]